MTEVFVLGLEDPDSLDDRQKLDFEFLIYDLFKAFENGYYHHVHGTLGEDAWSGWRRFIEQYATAPGAQRYWSVRRDIFTTGFRDFIEGLEPTSDIKRVGADKGTELTGESVPVVLAVSGHAIMRRSSLSGCGADIPGRRC